MGWEHTVTYSQYGDQLYCEIDLLSPTWAGEISRRDTSWYEANLTISVPIKFDPERGGHGFARERGAWVYISQSAANAYPLDVPGALGLYATALVRMYYQDGSGRTGYAGTGEVPTAVIWNAQGRVASIWSPDSTCFLDVARSVRLFSPNVE